MKYGLFLLGRRDYSLYEFRAKLEGHCAQIVAIEDMDAQQMEITIEATIARLSDLGYLNDERYAQGVVRREAQRGRGPVKIRWALRQKQVCPGIIEAALAEEDWQEVCDRALKAKSQKYDGDSHKIMRYLASRGFMPDLIQVSLNNVRSEA